jgi:hypothetical protein
VRDEAEGGRIHVILRLREFLSGQSWPKGRLDAL